MKKWLEKYGMYISSGIAFAGGIAGLFSTFFLASGLIEIFTSVFTSLMLISLGGFMASEQHERNKQDNVVSNIRDLKFEDTTNAVDYESSRTIKSSNRYSKNYITTIEEDKSNDNDNSFTV